MINFRKIIRCSQCIFGTCTTLTYIKWPISLFEFDESICHVPSKYSLSSNFSNCRNNVGGCNAWPFTNCIYFPFSLALAFLNLRSLVVRCTCLTPIATAKMDTSLIVNLLAYWGAVSFGMMESWQLFLLCSLSNISSSSSIYTCMYFKRLCFGSV